MGGVLVVTVFAVRVMRDCGVGVVPAKKESDALNHPMLVHCESYPSP